MSHLPDYGDRPDPKKPSEKPDKTPPKPWPRYDDDPGNVHVPDLPNPDDEPDESTPPERRLPRYGDLPKKTVFGEAEDVDEPGSSGETS